MSRSLVLLAVLLVSAAGSARAQDAAVDSLALARQYTAWLYAGEVDSLLAHSNEAMQQAYVEDGTYTAVHNIIAERAGMELSPVEETWKLRNGRCQYWRTASFELAPEPIVIRWVIDPDGRIDGLGAGPLSQAPPVEAETCEAQS